MFKSVQFFFLTFISLSTFIFAGAPLHESHEIELSETLTEFRDIMSSKLHDIDHVDRIISEYIKLKEHVDIDFHARKMFKLWLRRNCCYIGSKQFNHDLVYRYVPRQSHDPRFRAAYKQFVKKMIAASEASHEPIAGTNDSDKKRIAILYSGCFGGGHRAPATALQQNFEKNGYKTQLIDIDVFINHYSPRVQGYTLSQVYPEIFQKEGNVEKARRITAQIKKLHKPERRKFLWALKRVLIDFQPDHIFAVAHHRPELSYLSYQLSTPMTYVHTDYHFNRHLMPIVAEQARLPKSLISFSLLTREPCFLKNLREFLEVKNGKLPEAVQRQLVRLDFPVRDSFMPVGEKEIQQIRKTLLVPEKAIVCKLAIGQNPVKEEIRKLILQFVHEERHFDRPVYLFVICGSNTELKTWLEKSMYHVLKKAKNLDVDIRGFLDEREMAMVDKIATVWITKPGGSTCAELVQMRKQMLYRFAPHHVWEHGNAHYLQCLGLAAPFSEKRGLYDQIRSRVYHYEQVKKKELRLSAWKKQALYIFEHARREWKESSLEKQKKSHSAKK